ncbi:SLC2A4 regulator [Tupaia chinensis]|uniref:SLC2A4 regulator n=1 Tax=Tupaia chinensis TaxID=246437 RepID=L8Y8P6_TUPCH|nr:SLC2A4 regulator [Tupaia chinensis]
MATWVSWTPPALWTFGCSALLLCLWALCSACSRYSPSCIALGMPLPGPRNTALRPASMDLLHPRWLEVSVGGTGLRASSAVPHQELPRPLPAAAAVLPLSPEATYSNVGLAAIPRASLAASPVVWAGAGLTRSCARPGPGASPVVAEYACPEKLKETDWGARKQAEVTAAAQVDVLYSRVCKPKRTGLGHATAQPLPQDRALPLRGLGMDSAPPENVYESIREGPPVGGSFAGLEFALPQEPEPGAADLRAPGTWAGVAARLPTPSVHIPVPAQRRQAEPEQSDGEEDFYYTEVDVGVDALTDGLSGLSAMSPTTCMPPTSPRLELPGLLEGPALPSTLSSVGSFQTWHSDHACQGCLHPSHLESQPAEVRACAPALSPKLGASLRRPRGDAKKCRKVYGMDHRALWCTACRWKKACQRFLD